MDAAEYEARGLFDPKAPNAADRLALLEWLADRGLSIEQMVEAAVANRLTAVAGDLALRPGERLTMLEVAESTGLTVEQVRQLSLTIGLPVDDVDERIYTPGDVSLFKLFSETTTLFPESSLMQFVRVLGSSLARIADAAVSLFLADVETPITDAQAGEFALARAQLDAISALSDDAAFPGYPYPLTVADRLAACPPWLRADVRMQLDELFDRAGVPLDVRERAFADRHQSMERA